MSRLDAHFEGWGRVLARRTGRRSFLGRVGALLAGGAALPLLPVARASADSSRVPAPSESIPGPEGDPTRCEYWRHCAIDGFLCACCGGSATTCPPGTEMAPVTWIGTCRNPADGNEGDRPEYHWARSNDINWCAGAKSQAYHCSVAIVIGQATEAQPER
jgi:methylamine dehydrogenase light chain